MIKWFKSPESMLRTGERLCDFKRNILMSHDVTHLHQLSSTCKAGKGNRVVSPTHPLCWETSESGLPWRRRPEAPKPKIYGLMGKHGIEACQTSFYMLLTFCKPMEGQWQVDTGSDHAWAALKFSPAASTAQARMSTQFVKLRPMKTQCSVYFYSFRLSSRV